MASYHLYYLRNNMLVGSDDIEAADDQDAADIARTLGEGSAIEIWNDHSRVRIVAPARGTAQLRAGLAE